MLSELASEIHTFNRRQGFYDRESHANLSFASEKLLLIVSEVAEVQDALRDDNLFGEAEELADVLIRVLDYAAWRGINLDHEVKLKMQKNSERPRLHGRAGF
jgi:NTP pyrophosphatase (non-canonical NTP hydrolase)